VPSVYEALASFRNKVDGTSWPCVDTLCQLTGRHRTTVLLALKKLREVGIIVRIGKDKSGTIKYYLPQLARELPIIATAAGIEIEVVDPLPLNGPKSPSPSQFHNLEGSSPATQTDKEQKEQRLPPLGDFGEQIFAELTFFSCCMQSDRRKLASEAEVLAKERGIPASRIPALVTKGWENDRDRIGQWIMAHLKEGQ
jgi:helix-turn-helix protein